MNPVYGLVKYLKGERDTKNPYEQSIVQKFTIKGYKFILVK